MLANRHSDAVKNIIKLFEDAGYKEIKKHENLHCIKIVVVMKRRTKELIQETI